MKAKVNDIFVVVLFLIVLLAAVHSLSDEDEEEVKYCIDHTTGEVIAVEINMPCPYPMVEL